jgi:nitrate/TMAO reductase-like tetraheme cytochrome c subunit
MRKGSSSFASILIFVIGMSGAAPRLFAESTYDAARWDPIHFQPAIAEASDEQCLACHQEIIERRVRTHAPSGLAAADTLAWYQTLDTYEGEQETFHRRHLVNGLADQLMALKCNTCHQGNDPRDESAGTSADASSQLTQRKQVDPMICVMCHGRHNGEVMGVPPGDWREAGQPFSFNCLICHAGIRTNRHQVNYLKAEEIEKAGKESPDVCFGCHGGRAWYRISYPYPRHPWPGSGETVPEWASARPTESEARFRLTE